MDAQTHSPERRLYRRADVFQALEITPVLPPWRISPPPIRGEMVNIGCGGIHARVQEFLDPGTRCRIRFRSEGGATETDEVKGEVRWAKRGQARSDVGIAFAARMDVLRRPVAETGLDELPKWQPRRVLVADDEPEICAILSRFLTGLGCEVEIASDGEEALEALRGDRPDVFLLDLRMPRLDGLGVLERIQAEELEVGRIWAISGYATDDEAERALQLGATDFINKPLDLQYLEWSLEMSELGS